MTMRSVLLLLALLPGCKGWSDKLDARRLELRDSARACPAPATCTDKHAGDGGRDYPTCSKTEGPWAEGDIVLFKELGVFAIARIDTVKQKGEKLDVQFADKIPVERGSSQIVARVCK